MIIGYVKELHYMEKYPPEQLKILGKWLKLKPPRTSTDAVGEVTEILYDKLPHHDFYLKLKLT